MCLQVNKIKILPFHSYELCKGGVHSRQIQYLTFQYSLEQFAYHEQLKMFNIKSPSIPNIGSTNSENGLYVYSNKSNMRVYTENEYQ